jgi:hypothetical protein
MKAILLNLSNILMLQYCKQHNINPSGSYPVKNGRGYKYNLISETTGKPIVSVKFDKSRIPEYIIYKETGE